MSQNMDKTCAQATRTAVKSRVSAYVPAAALFLASVVFLSILLVKPQPGQPVLAVVYPPGVSAGEALRAITNTDALVLRQGLLGNILVVRSPATDFANRLYQSGALFVLDPISAFGCLTRGEAPLKAT